MMTSSNGNTFCVTGPLWGNPPAIGGFPSQRPVTQNFDIFFDLWLYKRLSKQTRRQWLRCHHTHYNVTVLTLQGLHHTISSYVSQWEGLYCCSSKDNDKNQYSTILQTLPYLERYEMHIKFSDIWSKLIGNCEMYIYYADVYFSLRDC